MDVVVAGASKRFGGLQALENVSLRVSGGEVTTIIGPNGAGKSTLLDCLSGITPLDAGRITIDGRPFAKPSPARLIATGITRTFQNIRLFPSLSAREHVLLARRYYLRSSRGRAAQPETVSETVDRLLARVGLAAKAHARPDELAYGERRRLEIARALATAPHLLLLDEPAAGSTLSEQATIAELIRGIAAEGVAVILVEHHMGLVEQVSTRVVVLDFGRVLTTGTIGEVRANPDVIAAYLGVAA
jgi:ABC-type branched-subunit amino acid transport system ATPase component